MSSNADLEIVEHDAETESYRVAYDRSTLPSEAVPATIAEITETQLWELRPLHAAVDTEALDELFEQPRVSATRRTGRVTFTYEGHSVTVFSDRRLLVRAAAD